MSDHTRTVPARRTRRQSVGVRELKAHAAHILRHVRESQASYVVTHRGRAVGLILPIDEPEATPDGHESTDAATAWNAFIQAGSRLERRFTAGVSGVELLSGSRR